MSEPTLTSAPSNIALIKYMGKTKTQGNRPTNASLSYTLGELKTFVSLETLNSSSSCDRWELLKGQDLFTTSVSEHGQRRYLKHLSFLKQLFGYTDNFLVKSANNFPSDCGLASSASSFAALTKAACRHFEQRGFQPNPNLLSQLLGEDFSNEFFGDLFLSQLSQRGSGSSCRSFFAPWGLWEDRGARPVPELKLELLHMVVIVDDHLKSVSSSQAHQRVQNSLNFYGRPERANQRLKELMQALHTLDWERAYHLCWQEFIDMHSLFESSHPPFHYMTTDSMKVLNEIRQHWYEFHDGPLVTMDAGPNIHFLFRKDQKNMLLNLQNFFAQDYRVFSSV